MAIEARRCPDCGVLREDADEFIEHFEIDLDRCVVCEKRDALRSDKQGRTGNSFGLKFRWWPRKNS